MRSGLASECVTWHRNAGRIENLSDLSGSLRIKIT